MGGGRQGWERCLSLEEVGGLRKIVVIVGWLVQDEGAYEGRTNQDLEREVLEEMPPLPHVACVEKVAVLDAEG